MPEPTQKSTSLINSPHELALGVAFGVVIGLMPKDSAFPWLIGLVLLLSRGNLLCGILATIVASIFSTSLDGIFDRMGLSLLSLEFMQARYAAWMEISWMAWTRFNNTVVAGSLFFGLLASLPVYLLSQVFFRVWGITIIERIMDIKLIRILFDRPDSNTEPQDPSPVPGA